jgi:hypothetical protein
MESTRCTRALGRVAHEGVAPVVEQGAAVGVQEGRVEVRARGLVHEGVGARGEATAQRLEASQRVAVAASGRSAGLT